MFKCNELGQYRGFKALLRHEGTATTLKYAGHRTARPYVMPPRDLD